MPQPIQPDLVRRLKSVADPSLSPNGEQVAYTLSWIEPETWESRSRVMLTNLATRHSDELTDGNKDSAPRFSPDGKMVAFLRGEGDQPKQLWTVDPAGGEPAQISDEPGGVIDFAWSPDSQQLVFCAGVDPDALPDSDDDAKLPQVKAAHRIRYRYDPVGWRGDAHFHLFVVSVNGAQARQLTDGDWDDLSPVWSPDGSRIAFISGRRDDRDFRALTEAYVVSASGGEAALWSDGLNSVGGLCWSPDSQKLLAIGSQAPGFQVTWQGWLYVLEPGREPKRITDDSFRPNVAFPSTARSPEIRWTGDDLILLLGESHGESYLYQASPSGKTADPLAGGGWASSDLSLDASAEKAVVLSSAPVSPGDLHLLDVPKGDSNQITDYNREYLQEHPAARLEKFTINRNGWDIQCRLYFPPGFDASRQYPLVLDIHGGPNGAFYDSFVAWQQVLATNGYLVLAVNPRGSSTYGEDFMTAVLGDWGGEDYLDLMAALDEVSRRSYVNEERLGVHGYSYGGYMTSWTVGHTHRFQAAVVGAPCINLHSMYGTSDIGISFGEGQWEVSIEEAGLEGFQGMALKLLERSPIAYVSRVETPVLLLHGEADARCPISQSEEYFTMLKRLGKEVEMVRFPGCSHLFLRSGHPKMREEYLTRTLAWFDRHIGSALPKN